MALKLFIFSIIFVSFFLTNLSVVEDIKVQLESNLPKISFFNSTMYEIDTEKVNKMMQAEKFLQYEDREELYFANLTLLNANNNFDTIIAQYIQKKDDFYIFRNNVILKRENEIELKTDTLNYDDTLGLATNQSDFTFRYKNSFFSGSHLYLNRNDMAIQGNNVHFVIKRKDL